MFGFLAPKQIYSEQADSSST